MEVAPGISETSARLGLAVSKKAELTMDARTAVAMGPPAKLTRAITASLVGVMRSGV